MKKNTLLKTSCLLWLIAAVLAGSIAIGREKTGTATLGKIVRLDPRLDALIAKDAKIEILAEGFVWLEGSALWKTRVPLAPPDDNWRFPAMRLGAVAPVWLAALPPRVNSRQ